MLALSHQISGFRPKRGVVINQPAFAHDCMILVKADVVEVGILEDCARRFVNSLGKLLTSKSLQLDLELLLKRRRGTIF